LSLLRSYNLEGKLSQVEERDGHIIFGGEFSWPQDSLTNFIKYSVGESRKKEYYTLGCLLYFLKNEQMDHPQYVKHAGGEGLPVVSRPDRKVLLSYLKEKEFFNRKDVYKHIDKSATLVVPTTVKRKAENKLESDQAKKAKRDTTNLAPEQEFPAKPFSKTIQPIRKPDLRNLNESLTVDRLAEIRAKRLANRRGQISEDVDIKAPTLAKEITFKNEKQYRTRTTILESAGKTFFKTINATLSSIKAREEGKMIKPPQQTPRPGGPIMMPPQPQPRQLPNYNRYDQEQFHGKDTHGFNIETTGTFSGMTLRSVTEGNANARNKQQHPQQQHQPQSHQPQQNNNTNGVVKTIPPAVSSNNSPNSGGKRPSRTPIIIISAAPKSLITMYNAKEILQDLRFISTEDMKAKGAGMKRDNEVLIQRRKEGGLTVPYRVIDNPKKLSPPDWDRVVAVFVMGQAWQFKDWPWDGNPTVIFSKICAFHLKWDQANLEKNIANWAVQIIPLSLNQRHLDRARLKVFWDVLDRYMVNNKPHLRY